MKKNKTSEAAAESLPEFSGNGPLPGEDHFSDLGSDSSHFVKLTEPGDTFTGVFLRKVAKGMEGLKHPGLLFAEYPSGELKVIPDNWSIGNKIAEIEDRGDDASGYVLRMTLNEIRTRKDDTSVKLFKYEGMPRSLCRDTPLPISTPAAASSTWITSWASRNASANQRRAREWSSDALALSTVTTAEVSNVGRSCARKSAATRMEKTHGLGHFYMAGKKQRHYWRDEVRTDEVRNALGRRLARDAPAFNSRVFDWIHAAKVRLLKTSRPGQ